MGVEKWIGWGGCLGCRLGQVTEGLIAVEAVAVGGELGVGHAVFGGGGVGVAYGEQLVVLRRGGWVCVWAGFDVVVGELLVGDVGGGAGGHVTGGAVGLLGVVRGHLLAGVAGEAAGAEVLHAFGGGWGGVGIVAGGAGESVASGAFAGATEEGFVLAAGAGSAGLLAGADEVDGGVGEVFAGLEVGEVVAGAVDDGVAFEMALNAGAVATGGAEFRWVEDGGVAVRREVLGGVAVAGAAADSALQEGGVGEAVAGR